MTFHTLDWFSLPYQCKAAVAENDTSTTWCCFLYVSTLHYKSGDYALFYKPEVSLNLCGDKFILYGGCKNCTLGWGGTNCDVCARGWRGGNCDKCKFGFEPSADCARCVENGVWQGELEGTTYTVTLTFQEPDCTEIVHGKLTIIFKRPSLTQDHIL